MTSKKRHVWIKRSAPGKPEFCERCGMDRTPAVEKEGCRPTRIF